MLTLAPKTACDCSVSPFATSMKLEAVDTLFDSCRRLWNSRKVACSSLFILSSICMPCLLKSSSTLLAICELGYECVDDCICYFRLGSLLAGSIMSL